MASIGDIFLRLLIDDSDFEKQVVAKAQKAGNKAGLSMGAQMAAGLSSGASKIGGALASVGQNLTKTGSAMTRNLTLPILAAGGAVAHFALDFDTTMRRIVGLAKVPKEEIEGVRASILKMGEDIGRSPQELAEAFYFVASAGFKADEAMKVLEISAKASAAGMGQVQDIAKTLGGVINAYGHENLSAAHAGDILTAAIQDGAAEASDFAGVIGFVVPVAASLGVSFDQVAAALSAMTQVGISADTAATNLGQVMAALQKPTKEAEDAMRGLGLSSAGLRAELREKGLLATLRTLEERFAGNEEASALVFGNIRALRGVTALLGLDTAQLNGIFADTAGALDNLQGAYDDTAGPQRELDKAMASLQATAIELGADVLPMVVDVVKQIAEGAKALGRWWKSLDADQRKQIVQWLAWIAVAGPALLIVGKLASGLGAVFKVVGFLAGAKGIPRLVGALKGLSGAGFVSLLTSLAAVPLLLEKIRETEQENLAKGKGPFLIPTSWFGFGFDQGQDLGAAFRRGVGEGIRGRGKGWGRTFEPIEEIPKIISAALVGGQWQVDQAAEAIPDPIAEALEKAKQDVADRANDLLHTLATTLSSNPKELLDAAAAMWEDILHPFPDMKHKLVLLAILARKDWVIGLTSPDSGDRARTAEYLKGQLAEFEALAPGVLASGEGIPPALQAGIDNTLDALTTYLKTTVIGDILDPFDLADELDRMGYDGLAGYVRGLERSRIDKLQTVGGRILRDTKIALYDDYYQEGYDAASSYGSGLAAGGKKAITYVQNFVGKIAAMLRFSGSPPYTHSREAGEGVTTSYMGGLIQTFRSFLPRLGHAIAEIGRAMLVSPALAGIGVAGLSLPSMGGLAASAGALVAGPTSTTNQTIAGSGGNFTIENMEINLHGVGSDVSPGAARRFGENIRDEVTSMLRDQAAQIVRVRPAGP